MIDEADRLFNQSYHGWVGKVIQAAYRCARWCLFPQTSKHAPIQMLKPEEESHDFRAIGLVTENVVDTRGGKRWQHNRPDDKHI